MRFDLHLRRTVADQLDSLADQMAGWDTRPEMGEDERERILEAITPFDHTTKRENLVLAGVDGSGDYPSLSYADSFVYLSTAQATTYESNALCGLREAGPTSQPVVDFTWLPEDEQQRRANLDAAFCRLARDSIESIIERSDYLSLKRRASGHSQNATEAADGLIRPHAADSGNLAIQLRSTAELAAALREFERLPRDAYLFVDGTFSLPFIGGHDASLFHEHLKRLCCVEARDRGICFVALSKSHGLPGVEVLEEIARERCGHGSKRVAEHWFFRIPSQRQDRWRLSMTGDRQIPPVGAVTYLVRFHKNVPVLRLDMDESYWNTHIAGGNQEETRAAERRLFEDLDYASHDQRCFGYPYPIKAAHDRASMTQAERVALRKQVIDAAVRAGMRRSLFRDASRATGHA